MIRPCPPPPGPPRAPRTMSPPQPPSVSDVSSLSSTRAAPARPRITLPADLTWPVLVSLPPPFSQCPLPQCLAAGCRVALNPLAALFRCPYASHLCRPNFSSADPAAPPIPQHLCSAFPLSPIPTYFVRIMGRPFIEYPPPPLNPTVRFRCCTPSRAVQHASVSPCIDPPRLRPETPPCPTCLTSPPLKTALCKLGTPCS